MGKLCLCGSPSLTKSCLADCRELWGAATAGCFVSSPYLEQNKYGGKEVGALLMEKDVPEAANRSGLLPFPKAQLRIFHKLICCEFLLVLFCFGWGDLFKTRATDKFLSIMS